MDLNINSPVYYSEHYGIDDDVYRMCRNIRIFMKDKIYSDIVEVIAITPVIAPEDLNVDKKWRNSIHSLSKGKVFDVHRSINFEEYINADIDNKCRLILTNIMESVKAVSGKVKFNYVKFQKDIEDYFQE